VTGDPPSGRRLSVRGVVQGVGMRPFVHRIAVASGVAGRVWNDSRGVVIEVFGRRSALDAFAERLQREKPAPARYDELEAAELPFEPAVGFSIVESARVPGELRVSIPPDLATCDDCLRELRDPADRRHRYPFTNCTNCGPRFTIASGVPYDRPLTTMAAFTMCADCAREYRDPSDRRFHAEPNACPRCGPSLSLVEPGSAQAVAAADAALRAAAAALAAGRIVAVKGIGGFHLACDATSSAAVRRLRERKHREAKPLAVMVPDLAAAERLAVIGAADAALLTAPERPIVLARRRAETDIAPEVAPDTELLGLLLPYSPLHHLLLADAGRPLVMTSGNLSEEPIAFRNAEALERLGGIADLFLLHDREIEARADDSVAKVIRGRPLVMRRSRGWVPRGTRVRHPFPRPVLACGAHLKNTFCIGVGDTAYLGPHIGDLENLETLESLEWNVARMERFLGVRPEVLAHDLHPAYMSTRYALERAARDGIPAVAVQHHHAHAAAAMGEHGLEGPVLALAWDGTGAGDDGTAWGSELLVARYDGFERLATFRPIRLAGSDRAIREPWRIALAVLDDAFDGAPPLEALPLFAQVDPATVKVVRQMIASGFNAPQAHGAGRWFDAFGALVLGRTTALYEGQLAMALEAAADPREPRAYPYGVCPSERLPACLEVDLRPTVRAAVGDLVGGVAGATVAARFHVALADAAKALIDAASLRHGRLPVVLTGGCFQNARLAEEAARKIEGANEVYLHGSVPPGDGGIALGQGLVAARSV
jgi:hydrogenase maturation protein HypF